MALIAQSKQGTLVLGLNAKMLGIKHVFNVNVLNRQIGWLSFDKLILKVNLNAATLGVIHR